SKSKRSGNGLIAGLQPGCECGGMKSGRARTEADRMPYADILGECVLELLHLRPGGQPSGSQCFDDGLYVTFVDCLMSVRQKCFANGSSPACRASSSETRTSCSFSPGRMPTYSTLHSGAIASAISTSFMLGIFGTKISPPCIPSMQRTTNSTPCSSVSQNRVIRGSVTV